MAFHLPCFFLSCRPNAFSAPGSAIAQPVWTLDTASLCVSINFSVYRPQFVSNNSLGEGCLPPYGASGSERLPRIFCVLQPELSKLAWECVSALLSVSNTPTVTSSGRGDS